MKNGVIITLLVAASALSMGQTRPSIRPSELERGNRRILRPMPDADVPAYVQQSVCLLQMVPESNNVMVPFDQQSLMALINSPGVIDAAAAAVKLTPDQRREFINVVVGFNQRGNMIFAPLEVSIRPGCPNLAEDTASILLREITNRLSDYIKQAVTNQKVAAEAKRKQMSGELEDAQKSLALVRDKLKAARELTGYGTGMDARSQLANWKSELRRAETEASYARARLKAIESQTSATTQSQPEPPVAATRPAEVVENPAKTLAEALDRVVMLKREQAKHATAQFEAGKLAYREYLDAVSALAAAEADRMRYGGMTGYSGRNLQAGVSDLGGARVALTMAEAQVKTLNEQIAKVDEARLTEAADSLMELQQEENRLRNVVENVNSQVNNARSMRVDYNFTLYVLGVDAKKASS